MSEHPTQFPSRTTRVAFAATVLIGGMNFVAVKFSNSELPPLYGAGLRFASAAVILFFIAKLGRMELPRGTALLGAALYGILNFAVGYALMYVALLGISAGTTSTVLACVPLITLVLAVIHRQERFTVHGVVGGLFAVAGITVMSVRGLGADLPIISLLAAVGGAFAFAESGVLVKGFPKSHPITTNAVGMAVGAVALFMGSAVSGEAWIVPREARTWLVLVWLVVGGSVGLFGLFVFVISRWTASASAYAITLMPVVSVTLGAVLADEVITPEVIAGGALVVFGVYAGALARRSRGGGGLRTESVVSEERMVSEEEAFAR
jgi:drug/metabolite transporter (DMT)-like permease